VPIEGTLILDVLSALVFLAYVVISCFGLYLIKSAQGWYSLQFGIGFILYGLGAGLWMVILRRLPLSFAFPIAAGALVVVTLLTGVLFLEESLPLKHLIGAGLICVWHLSNCDESLKNYKYENRY
jgi:multidrug transporter EmrE-like cation transporter